MKPVDQTQFGVPNGNCFSACVASILELPLDEVPFFMGSEGDWFDDLNDWLRDRGLYAIRFAFSDKYTFYPAGYYIVGGVSPRNPDALHAVVALGDKVVHDPNPARQGVKKWVDWIVIMPLDVGVWKQAV